MYPYKHIYIAILLYCSFISIQAQTLKVSVPADLPVVSEAVHSAPFKLSPSGDFTPISLDLNWRPSLLHRCVKHHSRNETKLMQIKNTKAWEKDKVSLKTDSETGTNSGQTAPKMGANFKGNGNEGTSPLDNSIAISNDGKIVSVANSSVEFYETNGTRTFTNTIDGFFNDATITDVCDPVIIYDSGEDKFIFFAEECSGLTAQSQILICFSQTNNPSGKWFKYKLTGNPAKNNTAFDYPKLALSNNELYISGNSFNDNGDFIESILYQIEKKNGFLGQTLNWQFWNKIASDPFTLLPVSYGHQGNYGPGCFLVATESTGASAIELYELTDDMSAANEKLNHYSIAIAPFSPAADAKQQGTSIKLDISDCRSLSGFYLDGVIHFVFHSDKGNGDNAINYCRLDVANKKVSSSLFGETGYDLAYPAISSYTTSKTDKSVMIGYAKSSSKLFPEIRAVFCDNTMQWSNSILIKSGEGFVNYSGNGSTERWGDYSGMCRKHNSTVPAVWMSHMYGTKLNEWYTWISELTDAKVGSSSFKNQLPAMQVFPNPVEAEFKTSFLLHTALSIDISVYDALGNQVKNLYTGTAKAGDNIFSFYTDNLANGTYILSITSNNQILKNETIVVAR